MTTHNIHIARSELKPGTSTIENDVLVAPIVPSDKKNQEKLREKLATKKEKRKLEKKLKAVKGLADDADDDESAAAWLKKRFVVAPLPCRF